MGEADGRLYEENTKIARCRSVHTGIVEEAYVSKSKNQVRRLYLTIAKTSQLDGWDHKSSAPCALVHTQSSTVQEFSILLKSISDETLGPSCCHFYFSLNPGRQNHNCKVADVQLQQARQSLKLRQVLPQLLNQTFKIGKDFHVGMKAVKHLAWSKARESPSESPIKLMESHLPISVRFRSSFYCITYSSGIRRGKEALNTNP